MGKRGKACSCMVIGAWAGVSWGKGSGWREEDAPVLRGGNGISKGYDGWRNETEGKMEDVCSWLISSISCDVEGIWLEV